MTGSRKQRLEDRCGRPDLDLVGTARVISRIPYGRPTRLTVDGVLDEWTGTCSTKHMLLAAVISEAWPELHPRLWHRPYLVTPDLATARWGTRVAEHVPGPGLWDVHTFATLEVGGRAIRLDVTVPLGEWDGATDVQLACGDGEDHPAGEEPLVTKAELVARHCEPVVRERFIAALSMRP